MLNQLTAFIRRYDMIVPGDHIVCAVSGGADSVALLFGLYLLKEKLQFTLSAAHFNHHLRGEESDRDAEFVKAFCDRYDIPLHMGAGEVKPGKKGLEAAARDARYAFLRSLPGKIATAHTADDNAETVLLHLVRGTGLKGLCGISPVRERLIRPMLSITRCEVEAFLEEYCLHHITDSSNETDQFLRNRLRHHIMPLLQRENPRTAESLSAMALRLQAEEKLLSRLAEQAYSLEVDQLRQMDPAIRSRCLERCLKEAGVKEPEHSHIEMAEKLIFSENPSAWAEFPGGVTLQRCYGVLESGAQRSSLPQTSVAVPGVTELPGLRITCQPAQEIINNAHIFTVSIRGNVVVRSRQAGDEMRLPGGTKSLKKIFIDRKIPQHQRALVPVLADEQGVVGVGGIGVNENRIADKLPAMQFMIETTGGF